jgi:tetratricopeptide (TPR) repeat protein
MPSVWTRIVPVGAAACLMSCALFRDYSQVDEGPRESVPAVNWLARGDSAYEREEYAEAAVHYRESARQGQQPAVAWFNCANAMVRLDRSGEAEEAYRRALKAAPDFLKAHQNLAALYQIDGKAVEAARHYEAAARLDSADANSRFRLGELAQQAGDPAEAMRWYDQTLRRDSLHEGAVSGMVQILLAARDTAAARVWIEKFNVRAPKPVPWALILQADLSLGMGSSEEALGLYREAATANPEDARPWLRMAKALRSAGRPLEAGVVLGQALEASSMRGELWAALGSLRFEGGDPLGAREAYARAFRLGSAEGVQGLEILAAWQDRRQEGQAAKAIRDTLGSR